MNYGSVCSGIEAASVAWEPLGWSPSWFAEVDAFPSAVLAHHWPHVPNLGDMTKIRDLIAMGLVNAPDVLVGGTPCQAFSIAGLRESMDDHRGQLSLEYVKLLNQIDETRREHGKPECTAVWENVPGVLNTKDNAFGCFLSALAGGSMPLVPPGPKWRDAGIVAGPQRVVAWRVLNSQYFGVAQRRRRVFVVACPPSTGLCPGEILFEAEGRTDPPQGVNPAGALTTITCGSAGNVNSRGVVLFEGGNFRALTPEEEEQRQGFVGTHTLIPGNWPETRRYKAIGNSMTTYVMRWIGTRIHALKYGEVLPWI